MKKLVFGDEIGEVKIYRPKSKNYLEFCGPFPEFPRMGLSTCNFCGDEIKKGTGFTAPGSLKVEYTKPITESKMVVIGDAHINWFGKYKIDDFKYEEVLIMESRHTAEANANICDDCVKQLYKIVIGK